VSAVPDDLPLVLPAVVASNTVSQSFLSPTSTLDVAGFDGDQVTVDATVPAVSLPGLGRSGVMVDLTLARRAQTSTASGGTISQVWLATDAPAALIERLRAAGLSIVDDESAVARERYYDHSGPTYGIQMFLVMAGAAGALGVGVVLAFGLISARRRAYDYASLRVVGVRERALRRAATGELAGAVLVGLAVGIGSGLGGTALATHALPLFVHADVGLPRVSSVPWLPVVALCGGLVMVLAAVCVIVVAVVRRNAGVTRLREGVR
jgi:ABC-type antimicrobial peptide transport system permease subunit